LQTLAQYQLLTAQEAGALTDAYVFLREVEHRLQMEDNRQIHTIPDNLMAQERLTRLMGFSTLGEFQRSYRAHAGNVRRIFDKILKIESMPPGSERPFPAEFEGAEAEWKQFLAA